MLAAVEGSFPFPFPSEPRGRENRVRMHDSPLYDPETGRKTEIPGRLVSRPSFYGFGMMGFQEGFKVGGLAGKRSVVPKFPVPPCSLPNPVQLGGLSAVEPERSPEGKQALRQSPPGWGEGVVAKESENGGSGVNLGGTEPPFPGQKVPWICPDLPSCLHWGEPPVIPG